VCGASPGTVFTGDDVVKLASDPIVMGLFNNEIFSCLN
jgi:hypothetical protein